jgi:hypothetical protein
MSANNWRESPEGIARVKQILRRGGVPLELQARKISDEFIRELKDPETRMSSTPLVYRGDQGTPREFDWFVSFKRRVQTEHVTFEVDFRVVIECKQKDGVEWFGFEAPKVPGKYFTDLIPPLLSNSAYSGPFNVALLENNQLELPEHRVTALEFKAKGKGAEAGKGDPTLYTDPVIMDVAAASFDYLEYAARRRDELFPFIKPALLHDMQIVARFKKAVGTRKLCDEHIVQFLHSLTADDHGIYLTGISKGTTKQDVYVMALIPVLCVSGPLHKVEMSAEVEIERFASSVDFVANRVHLEQWPGSLKDKAIMRGAGYPVILTSISKLSATLRYVHGMARATAYAIEQLALRGVADLLPLELAVMDELRALVASVRQDPA